MELFLTSKDGKITLREAYLVLHTDEQYKPPPPHILRAVREKYHLTQIDVAKMVGVSWSHKRGSSTVAKWETDPSKKDHRQIPYSAWHLLLITLNVVEVEEYKREK